MYWPDYAAGVNDLLAPIFVNAAGNALEIQYAAAPSKPDFTSVPGRAIFTLLGYYGTYPSSGPAALTKNQLLIPQGYYFLQTGPASFDMISALDAKAWISWQFPG